MAFGNSGGNKPVNLVDINTPKPVNGGGMCTVVDTLGPLTPEQYVEVVKLHEVLGEVPDVVFMVHRHSE